ncbi:MAG: hypothetical protein NC453_11475 [Muribaculum sp.]|nr:hypothetical protein [Muribaculum sp.]
MEEQINRPDPKKDKEAIKRLRAILEASMNDDSIDDDENEAAPTPEPVKPRPTVEEVVAALKAIEDKAGYEEDVTEWCEKSDETLYHIWMRLHVAPTRVEIICMQTETTYDGPVPYYKVVVEGVENVAKLILALHVGIEDTEDILDNLFEALSDKIPYEWAEDYYDPAQIIEKLRTRYDIEYKTVKL